MTIEEQKLLHNYWLWVFRQLELYTDGFTEPFAGKTNEWFLSGPTVSPLWVKNAAWAKCLIPRKYHYAVTPGIMYGTEFSRIQNAALELCRPETEMCWQLCRLANLELEQLNNKP